MQPADNSWPRGYPLPHNLACGPHYAVRRREASCFSSPATLLSLNQLCEVITSQRHHGSKPVPDFGVFKAEPRLHSIYTQRVGYSPLR